MDFSNQCREFVKGIAHPNEKVLAKEILEGKKVGEFSLSFDQAQVDAMTDRLIGGGCFEKEIKQSIDEELEKEAQEELAEETGEPKKDDAGGIGENDVNEQDKNSNVGTDSEPVKDETLNAPSEPSETPNPVSAPVGETGQGMDTPQAPQQA